MKLPSIDALREAVLVAGFLMLGRGLWLVYPPAMWLVCGSLLMWLGLPRGRRN